MVVISDTLTVGPISQALTAEATPSGEAGQALEGARHEEAQDAQRDLNRHRDAAREKDEGRGWRCRIPDGQGVLAAGMHEEGDAERRRKFQGRSEPRAVLMRKSFAIMLVLSHSRGRSPCSR